MRISDWSSDVCSSDLEVARLVHQHLRFVLELLDLVVDLLQRADRGQRVLHEVRGIDHDPLRMGGGGAKHGRDGGGDKTLFHGRFSRGWSAREPGARPGNEGSRSAAQSRPRWRSQAPAKPGAPARSEEHTSELQSLMRSSYAVFCLEKQKN